MTATKKSIRFFTVLALIFAMVVSIASVPASAVIGGPETWYKGSDTSPTLTIDGGNTTDRKTMGDSCVLTITAYYTPVNQFQKTKCVLEIRDAANNVIDGCWGYTQITGRDLSLRITVTKGQQFFIFMGTYDTSGNKIPSTVYYTYTLS